MITPDIEKELIKLATQNRWYRKSFWDAELIKLRLPFIEELKNILITRGIDYCKSKQRNFDKSVGKEISFYSTILKNALLSQGSSILCYLDESHIGHRREVESNGEIWKRILKQAKRDHLLKELLKAV